jgi:hypothetical protein
VHIILAFGSLCFLIASVSLATLCELTSLSSEVLHVLNTVGFGVDIKHGRCGGGFLGFIPELIVAGVAVVSCIVGSYCIDSSDFRGIPGSRQLWWRDFCTVGILSMACASVHCNIFAASYHLCSLGVVLVFSCLSPVAQLRGLLLRCLCNVLLVMASFHILSIAVFSVPTVQSISPKFLRILLGAEDTVACSIQCLLSFLLVELLAWSPPRFKLDSDFGTERATKTEGTPRSVPKSVSKHLDVSRTRSDARIARSTTSASVVHYTARSGKSKLTHNSDMLSHARTGHSSNGIYRAGATNTSGPTLLGSRPAHSFSSAKLAKPGDSCSGQRCTAWLFDAGNAMARSVFLPMIALMMWSVLWPSLPALPLLAMSLVMLHMPIRQFSRALLVSVLLYQVVASVAIYTYNVYLNAVDGPASLVPESYTWWERFGLQNYEREGRWSWSQRLLQVFGQALAITLFAVNLYSASVASQEAAREKLGLPTKSLIDAVCLCVACGRSAAVGFVLFMALALRNDMCIFCLGYILWALCLAMSGFCKSWNSVGWDSLHGHAWVWYTLLIYSQFIVLAKFCWVVIGTGESVELGFTQTHQNMLFAIVPHLVIASLACVQTRSLRMGVLQPQFFLSGDSLLARFSVNFGIFFQIAILFVIVMLPPSSADSFFFLLVFNATVTVEHFCPQLKLRNWLFLFCAIFGALFTVVRSVLLLPNLHAEVSRATPNHILRILGLELSVRIRAKIAVLASLVFSSCFLHRVTAYCRESSGGEITRMSSTMRSNIVMFLKIASRCSHRILMFAAFFLMNQPGALSTFQRVFLLAILLGGRFWGKAGALISGCSMLLLCVQYAYKFDFISSFLPPEQANYLGLKWSTKVVGSEVTLLLLGILQGAVQRGVKRASRSYDYETDETCSCLSMKLQAEIVGHGAQVAAVLLILVAVLYSTAWAALSIILVFVYVLSGDSRQRLCASGTNFWLRVFAMLLALSLSFGWALDIWRAPGLPAKPPAEEIAHSWICSMFDSTMSLDHSSAVCTPGSGMPCMTQQMQCANAWGKWIGENKPFGNSAWEFLAFFAICMIRKMCLNPPHELKRQSLPSSATVALSTHVATFDSDSHVPHIAQEKENRTTEGSIAEAVLDGAAEAKEVAPPTHDSESDLVAIDSLETAPVLSKLSQKLSSLRDGLLRSKTVNASKFPYRVYRSVVILLWISLASAFVSQKELDAISVGYMLLLLLHLHTECAHHLKEPYKSRMRILTCIRHFNLLVFMAFLVFQCPSLPCPYELRVLRGQPHLTGFFSSPQQCMSARIDYEATWMREETPAQHAFGIALRCVGLRKTDTYFSMGLDNFWSILVFIFAIAQAVIADRWRHELSAEFGMFGQRLQWRESCFLRYLQKWRRLEITRSDTKQRVLLTKLQHLIVYFNEVRKLWVDQRPAFTEAEERERVRKVRILDLSLESGVSEKQVEQVLNEFEAPFYQQDIESTVQSPLDEVTQKIVNRCVLKQVESYELLKMESMTQQELEEKKAERLQKLQLKADAMRKEQDEVNRIDDVNREGAESGENPACVGGHADAATAAKSSENSSDFICRLEHAVSELLCPYIDDLLWFQPGHETLRTHREKDSILYLFFKVLRSQTLCFLLAAAAMQFAVYQSIAAAVTIMSLLLSLMGFPHPSKLFWKILQWYNLLLVTLKMLYQLPVFCGDGQHFIGFSDCLRTNRSQNVTWEAILGFLKIRPGLSQKDVLIFSSVFEAFWADLLVCVLLFIHWDRLSNGGRLGNPARICRQLLEDDCSTPSATKERSGDSPLTAALTMPTAPVTPNTPASGVPSTSRSQSANQPYPSPRVMFFAPENETVSVEVISEDGESDEMDRAEWDDDYSWRQPVDPLFDELLPNSELPPKLARWPWLAHTIGVVCHLLVDSARMRKPAMNFYSARLALSVACFCIVLALWKNLTGSGMSFYDSLNTNLFSLHHVLCIVLFLALIVIDRALHATYQHQEPKSVPDGMDSISVQPETASELPVARADNDVASPVMRVAGAGRLAATMIQKLLLLVQLIVLHALCVSRWVGAPVKDVRPSMLTSPTLLIFYLLYISYLALTALQQQYDITVTRGGLGITHSTDTISWAVFKCYQAIPFLEELRVLADWTVTRSSMNFMMWMKLEDANQGLYEVQADMDWRREFAPGAPRPRWEKCLQGVGLLAGLFCLIVGPLLYFSPLMQGHAQPNNVIGGTFSVKLITESTPATIYESGSTNLVDLGAEEMSRINEQFLDLPSSDRARLQTISFPTSSSSAWLPALRQQVASGLQKPDAQAYLDFSLLLRLNGATAGSWRGFHNSVPLGIDQIEALRGLDGPDQIRLLIDNAWPSIVYVSGSGGGSDKQLGEKIPATLTFQRLLQGNQTFGSLGSPSGCVSPQNRTQCGFVAQVVSAKQAFRNPTGWGTSATIIGLYIGIVYTVGRFLRLIFFNRSKQVIYEELQDTSLLQDLCNGIYISRIHGLLKTEFNLYYELLHIYRSPMLLLDVSKPTGAWQRKDELGLELEKSFEHRSHKVQQQSRSNWPRGVTFSLWNSRSKAISQSTSSDEADPV